MSTTRYIETDALAGLRDKLMRAAARRTSSRRRTRRATIAVALLAALLAATAATAALTDFSTGVPVVDELVGIESQVPRPGDGPTADHRPGPGSASEALSVPIGDGVYKTVAYRARDGSICIVSAERHRGGVRGSTGGCPPLEDVNRRVERRGAVWYGSSHGPDQRTYQLLVGDEVKSVRPLGDGEWRVLMTPPWTPQAPGARALRLVVVIDETDIEVPQTDLPKLELTDADGGTRVAQGP